MVSTERGEIDETVEKAVGSRGDCGAIRRREKLEWTKYIPYGEDFKSVKEIVHRSLVSEPVISIRLCMQPLNNRRLPFVGDQKIIRVNRNAQRKR